MRRESMTKRMNSTWLGNTSAVFGLMENAVGAGA
jgi:hypothetical protein